MELLRGVFRRHVFAPHFHQTYVIEIVERGLDVFLCEGVVHRAPAGSIVFINPGEVHTGQSLGREPLAYRGFYPSPDFLASMVGRSPAPETDSPRFASCVVKDPDLYTRLLAAHRHLEPGGDAVAGREALQDAMQNAVNRHATDAKNTGRRAANRADVDRARAHMDSAFADRITNEALTSLAGMSQFHFIRVFRQIIGLTPHEYLVNVRIEHARRMLSEGMPIAHAARRSGFYDQSHLNRHFKRLTGVTPGQYRQSA